MLLISAYSSVFKAIVSHYYVNKQLQLLGCNMSDMSCWRTVLPTHHKTVVFGIGSKCHSQPHLVFLFRHISQRYPSLNNKGQCKYTTQHIPELEELHSWGPPRGQTCFWTLQNQPHSHILSNAWQRQAGWGFHAKLDCLRFTQSQTNAFLFLHTVHVYSTWDTWLSTYAPL